MIGWQDIWLRSRFRASYWWSLGILLIIRFTRCSWGWIKTPFGEERFLNLLGLGELKGAGFLGDNSTLVLRLQLGNKLGDESTGFLGIQITNFFRNINKRDKNFIMAFFWSFFKCTTGSTNFNW